MEKIIYVRFKKPPKTRLFQFSVLISLRLILIVAFQLSAVNVEASLNAPEYDEQTAETIVAENDIREIKPGETIERQAKTTEIHAYQIHIEAGTTVEITFGKRDMSFLVTALIPDNQDYSVPGQTIPSGKELSKGVIETGLVEPFVIVGEKTGNYVITVRAWSSGTYTLGCGIPHTTTETDRKYAAAGNNFQ